MNKSAGWWWAFKYALWLIAILAVLLLVVLPLVTSILVNNVTNVPVTFSKYLRGIETLQSYMMQILTAMWFFYFGSCIASFLNVVAWRVPRGRSILGSSKCPHCNTKLSFRDNVPIIGWLKNGGQCRVCATPISARYLLVEIQLGAIFLAIVMLSLVSGGMNMPMRAIDTGKGFERLLFEPRWDLVQIVIHHLTLISFLFTFALIRSEKKELPISVLAWGVIFGLIYTFAFPAVQIVHWLNPTTEIAGYKTFEIGQLITVAMGAIGGVMTGWLLDSFDKKSIRSSVCCLMLTGVFLGWQSTISIAIIICLLQIATSILPETRFDFSKLNRPAQILVATITHLLLWRSFDLAVGYWPNHQSNWIQVTIQLVVLTGLVWLGHRASETSANRIAQQSAES